MKRKELEAGKTYSYRTSDYYGASRIRVIDTEAVYRQSRGGYSTRKTENKDGIRVVFEEGSGAMFDSVNAERAEGILQRQREGEALKYGEKVIIDLFDGFTDEGEVISRVLPRYIEQPWADHAAAMERAAQRRATQAEEKRVRQDGQRALYAKLPDKYKEAIELNIYRDGSGGWDVNDWQIEALVKLLIEENA